jgi:hypothetical protein
MDETNRVFIVGVSLIWIFIVLLVVLLAWGAPDQSIERLGDLAGYLDDHNTKATQLIITFGGLILVLLAALVILFEIVPPRSSTLRVDKIGSGEGRIGSDEVAHRLEHEVRAIPQVRQVTATVAGRGEKAEVSLELHVAPESDLAQTAEEACRIARQLVEERMGVALARPPLAKLHYRELQLAPSAAVASTAPGPAPSAPAARSPFEPPAPSTPPTSAEPSHETEVRQEDRPAGA